MERIKLHYSDNKGDIASLMFGKIQEVVEWINNHERIETKEKPPHLEGIEAEIREFAKQLSEKVRYMAGKGQYVEEPERRTAYLDGVETAIGMMYIDLTGTPKTEGMLSKFRTTAYNSGMEQGRITEASNCRDSIGDCHTEYAEKAFKYLSDNTK